MSTKTGGMDTPDDVSASQDQPIFERHPLIIGVMIFDIALVVAGYVVASFGTVQDGQPGPLIVSGGLMGAFAVIVAVVLVAAILIQGGFTLLQSSGS